MKTLPSIMFGSAVVAVGAFSFATMLAKRPVAEWSTAIHTPYDSSLIDLQIRNNEMAVRNDPQGALGWHLLSTAYMRRSRESDDLATAVKAEAAARKSLDLRKLGNSTARNKLIQSLLQQHRFKDALAQCEEAKRMNIFDDQTVRSEVECLIEIGRYDEAGKLASANPRAFKDASGFSILARLLDIDGQPEQALKLLRDSATQVDQASGMSSDAIAWFHTKLAAQLAKMGKHDEARTEYETALRLYPRDYKSMGGLARLAFQDGRWNEAIAWGERSDAIAQMADLRAMVGDAYAMLGQREKAEEQYAKVAALVGRPSGMNDGLHEITPQAGTHGHRLDRQYAMYCADHGRDLEGAYAAAIRDFAAREDVYAFDTLAWVCFKRDELAEAKKAIERALSRGTQDPALLYHAGSIYQAAGEGIKGSEFMRRALAIDPRFDAIGAPRARMALRQNSSQVSSRNS
jgi:tetratricopeptide (TPR) repeat protein